MHIVPMMLAPTLYVGMAARQHCVHCCDYLTVHKAVAWCRDGVASVSSQAFDPVMAVTCAVYLAVLVQNEMAKCHGM